MNILSTRAYKKLLPLTRPYTITRETFSETDVIFFEIVLSNGIKGIGAASPEFAVVGETTAQTLENLQSDTVTQLAGKDIRCFLSLIDHYRTIYASFPGTQAAIDIALHDAFCKWIGLPVVDFYGRHHQKMLTSVTIGIKNITDTLEEAKEYYDRGFKALKVKTGLDAGEDAARIIKLRENFGNHFVIRVDANTGYDIAQLINFLDQTKNQQVELVEQPLLPGMEDELLQLPISVRSILAADESLKSPESALKLSQQMPYGIFNIKLMKCGGIKGALEIANIAKQADIALFWGCNDESRVSITAALHVAFSCRHTRYLDLDGSLDLAEDIAIDGFTLEDGYMFPNDKPGFGLTLLED